jgi:serine/threonine protein kinase/Flp pilus assembly protein TadD
MPDLSDQQWLSFSEHLDQALQLPEADLASWLADLASSEPEVAAEILRKLEARHRAGFAAFLSDALVVGERESVASLVGRQVGHYTIDSEVGRGGMGSVWRAHRTDGRFEGTVAIKFVHTYWLGRAAEERFLAEGRLLGRLNHPNIARLIDAGAYSESVPYLVLEYVEGESIDDYCDHYQLDVESRVALFRDVLAAVGHAHSHRIVHRDLKPTNILVTRDGVAKLLDFGIAKLLGEGASAAQTVAPALTPQYAAPEQLQGQAVTTATDVYALGLVLYRLLTGHHTVPIEGRSTAQIYQAVIELSPARASQTPGVAASIRRVLEGDLDNILGKALKKDPLERYASVGAFAEDLRRFLAHEPVRARPPPLWYRLKKFARRNRPMIGVSVPAALLLLAIGSYELKHRLSVPSPSPRSIAVLPLRNESGEASQQYFSDGISEDLINTLSQFQGLRVIGRSSSFQFRDSKENSRSIGAKLGVARLLEGSVRRSGDMIRVSAELIDTADGSLQWSQQYDRPYQSLFALQDEITRAVVAALQSRLLPGEHAAEQGDRPPGGNLEAYIAQLQGKFYLNYHAEADYRQAIEYYTQATQLDPSYAFAWAGLARSWASLGALFLGGGPAQEAYANSRAAAARALALSPDLASAHVARGRVLYRADFDWRGAVAESRRALELAPNDGEVKSALARQLATLGEVEQAIEFARQAIVSDPLQPDRYYSLATFLSGLNRLDEAEQAVRRAIELEPAAAVYHQQLAITEIQRGDAKAALEAAQQEPPGPWQDIALALARQIGNDRTAADTALMTLIEKDANGDPYQVAQVYALRNDAKKTFEWLNRALDGRDPGITNLNFDPFLLRYKSDPRFTAFCRKVGLVVK